MHRSAEVSAGGGRNLTRKSEEFTKMIVSQRGFQANSKIITASDEMLMDLVRLKG
jgi:flagellar basal body rod protein FlgG